ncbi:MAG: GGDEF domain-containing protein [Actinomycetota bacterium]
MERSTEPIRLVAEVSRKRETLFTVVREWAHDPGGRISALLLVYGASFVAWQIFRWGGDEQRTLISDLAFIPVSISAAVLARRAGRNPNLDSRTSRAWRMIAVSFFLYWLGDVIWSIEENLGSAPFPGIADIAYVAFYPVLLWGIFAFPTGPRSASERTKLWLDGGTVIVGAAMILWYFSLGPTAQDAGSSFLEQFVSLAYPIGDLVLIFGITRILLGQPPRGSGHALGVLATGLVFMVVGDVAFAHLSLNDNYQGGDWPDSAWMLAQILTAVAAQYQYWHASRGESGIAVRPPEPRTFSPFPYLAIFASFVLLAIVGWDQAVYPIGGLMVGALIVTTMVVARQIAALRDNLRLLRELQHLASTDPLTGLGSRRHFYELAEREFYLARRSGRPLAAMMIDIDHFKAINDSHGHAAGDSVLQSVARQCMAGLRAGDLIGRYGGDEIVVLLPDATLDAALATAGRIREQDLVVETPVGAVRATLSMGVASAGDVSDLAELLSRADLALYEAKQAGRNTTRAIA